MKKITFLLLMFTVISCKKDPGNFKGNVYWKYNEYVGNKGDAGSSIRLFKLNDANDNAKPTAETTTDVAGNFLIENLEPGKYLCLVKSKNTKSCGDDETRQLSRYQQELKELFNFDLATISKDITELEAIRENYSPDTSITDDNFSALEELKKYNKYQNDLMDKSFLLWQKLPTEFVSAIGFAGPLDKKLQVQVITIDEGKTFTENIDFGITCN